MFNKGYKQRANFISDDSNVPRNVQANIHLLLERWPQGLTEPQLETLYESQFGQTLNYYEYGFLSLSNFTKALPQIIRRAETKSQYVKLFSAANSIGEFECRFMVSGDPLESLPEMVRKNIQNLIGGSSGGIPLHDFLSLYKEKFKTDINPLDYGLIDIEEFLTRLNGKLFHVVDKISGLSLVPFQTENDEEGGPLVYDLFFLQRKFDRSHYPAGIVTPHDKLLHYDWSEDIKVGKQADIVITNIHKDNGVIKFQFHLRKHHLELMNLTHRLHDYYGESKNELVLPESVAVSGMFCVTRFKDDSWNRVIIEKIEPYRKGARRVYYVDHGGFWLLKRTSLYYMKEEFASAPMYAIDGTLAGQEDYVFLEGACERLRKFLYHADDINWATVVDCNLERNTVTASLESEGINVLSLLEEEHLVRRVRKANNLPNNNNSNAIFSTQSEKVDYNSNPRSLTLPLPANLTTPADSELSPLSSPLPEHPLDSFSCEVYPLISSPMPYAHSFPSSPPKAKNTHPAPPKVGDYPPAHIEVDRPVSPKENGSFWTPLNVNGSLRPPIVYDPHAAHSKDSPPAPTKINGSLPALPRVSGSPLARYPTANTSPSLLPLNDSFHWLPPQVTGSSSGPTKANAYLPAPLKVYGSPLERPQVTGLPPPSTKVFSSSPDPSKVTTSLPTPPKVHGSLLPTQVNGVPPASCSLVAPPQVTGSPAAPTKVNGTLRRPSRVNGPPTANNSSSLQPLNGYPPASTKVNRSPPVPTKVNGSPQVLTKVNDSFQTPPKVNGSFATPPKATGSSPVPPKVTDSPQVITKVNGSFATPPNVTGSPPVPLKVTGSQKPPKVTVSPKPPKVTGSSATPKVTGSLKPPKVTGSSVPLKVTGSPEVITKVNGSFVTPPNVNGSSATPPNVTGSPPVPLKVISSFSTPPKVSSSPPAPSKGNGSILAPPKIHGLPLPFPNYNETVQHCFSPPTNGGTRPPHPYYGGTPPSHPYYSVTPPPLPYYSGTPPLHPYYNGTSPPYPYYSGTPPPYFNYSGTPPPYSNYYGTLPLHRDCHCTHPTGPYGNPQLYRYPRGPSPPRPFGSPYPHPYFINTLSPNYNGFLASQSRNGSPALYYHRAGPDDSWSYMLSNLSISSRPMMTVSHPQQHSQPPGFGGAPMMHPPPASQYAPACVTNINGGKLPLQENSSDEFTLPSTAPSPINQDCAEKPKNASEVGVLSENKGSSCETENYTEELKKVKDVCLLESMEGSSKTEHSAEQQKETSSPSNWSSKEIVTKVTVSGRLLHKIYINNDNYFVVEEVKRQFTLADPTLLQEKKLDTVEVQVVDNLPFAMSALSEQLTSYHVVDSSKPVSFVKVRDLARFLHENGLQEADEVQVSCPDSVKSTK